MWGPTLAFLAGVLDPPPPPPSPSTTAPATAATTVAPAPNPEMSAPEAGSSGARWPVVVIGGAVLVGAVALVVNRLWKTTNRRSIVDLHDPPDLNG
jgi:hypothetical protein